ncbi:hypothetical protein AGR7C_Lc140019 [Agrobacterium deltaense Zutra 3/1]|uniref:Uncharacterized protein n=1 Tax=Agrobacterium deltaense Zutra 3/1 TaxID=1183427 RepID=A0A1S7R8J8_9HYPH|nr:hypothetical protein AGR7C_Lc140019 [Agrobacterium deltaense Zutra 3/1]
MIVLRLRLTRRHRHLTPGVSAYVAVVAFNQIQELGSLTWQIKCPVKPPVQLAPVRLIVALVVFVQNGFGCVEVFHRHFGNCKLERAALQGNPDLQHLKNVVDREATDDDPFVSLEADKSLAFELAQGLTDRDPRRPKPLCYLVLAQRAALFDLACNYGGPETISHHVRSRLSVVTRLVIHAVLSSSVWIKLAWIA